MPDLVLSRSDVFPVGTSVGAYPASGRSSSSGAVPGAAIESQTVAADGTATFTTLAADVPYVFYAVVSSEHRKVVQRLSAHAGAKPTWQSTVSSRRSASLAPENTAAPAITGTAQEGATLTATTGTWIGAATITYAYQWRRCDASGNNPVDIAAATAATYAAVLADVDSTIRVRVTADNENGTVSAQSAATAVVIAA